MPRLSVYRRRTQSELGRPAEEDIPRLFTPPHTEEEQVEEEIDDFDHSSIAPVLLFPSPCQPQSPVVNTWQMDAAEACNSQWPSDECQVVVPSEELPAVSGHSTEVSGDEFLAQLAALKCLGRLRNLFILILQVLQTEYHTIGNNGLVPTSSSEDSASRLLDHRWQDAIPPRFSRVPRSRRSQHPSQLGTKMEQHPVQFYRLFPLHFDKVQTIMKQSLH